MGCRTVSKTVRPDVWGVRNQRDPSMHHATNGALVEATATGAKEQSRPTVGGRQRRSAGSVPPFNSLHRRDAEGDGPLLVALAEHPDDVAGLIDVVDIESHQLTHPDTRGVEKFEDRIVTQLLGVNLAGRRASSAGSSKATAWA